MDAALLVFITLAVLGVLVAAGAAFYVSRGRGAAPDLEPPVDKAPEEAAERGAVAVEERPGEPAGDTAVIEPAVVEVEPEVLAPPTKPSLKDRLSKARASLATAVGAVLSRSLIDAETWDDLEAGLIKADIGVQTTMDLLEQLKAQVEEEGIKEPGRLLDLLKADLKQRLVVPDRSLHFAADSPTVWLFVGVNGVGKTTTIGKIGKREVAEGRTVIMAAGDTFRAAAAEQLEHWAQRCGADFVRGNDGADPSSVIFDAVERAGSVGADLVLADTAGRLHTRVNLMEELRKVRRVAEKGVGTVSEVLLVLDATTGQNGLVQASQFTDAVEVTGVVLTKLDGSAKGGIVLAIQQDLGIPVKLVGLGESADDLIDFDSDAFVEALFE
jgi:fused signal recognition particle receptor